MFGCSATRLIGFWLNSVHTTSCRPRYQRSRLVSESLRILLLTVVALSSCNTSFWVVWCASRGLHHLPWRYRTHGSVITLRQAIKRCVDVCTDIVVPGHRRDCALLLTLRALSVTYLRNVRFWCNLRPLSTSCRYLGMEKWGPYSRECSSRQPQLDGRESACCWAHEGYKNWLELNWMTSNLVEPSKCRVLRVISWN